MEILNSRVNTFKIMLILITNYRIHSFNIFINQEMHKDLTKYIRTVSVETPTKITIHLMKIREAINPTYNSYNSNSTLFETVPKWSEYKNIEKEEYSTIQFSNINYSRDSDG